MSKQLLHIVCGLDMMHVHRTFGHACLYFFCPVILAAVRSGFRALTAASCCMPSLAVVSAVDA